MWTRFCGGVLTAGLLFALGCGEEPVENESESEAEEESRRDHAPNGTRELVDFELDAAREAYQEHAGGSGSESTAGHIGLAYLRLLEDDFDGALEALSMARTEANEGEIAEIDVRQAMVELRQGNIVDYDIEGEQRPGARRLGEASGLPQGALIAGEIALLSRATEDAIALFEAASEGEGETATVANTYLELLRSDESALVDLAGIVANWSIGTSSRQHQHLRDYAVQDFVGLGSDITDTRFGTSEDLLIWAGRAIAEQNVRAARTILEWLGNGAVPSEQEWRVAATRAILDCVRSDTTLTDCRRGFERVEESNPPPDGLRDAKVTAAMTVGRLDPARVRYLLEDYDNDPATVRAMWEADPCNVYFLATDGNGNPLEGFLGDYLAVSVELEEQCSIDF